MSMTSNGDCFDPAHRPGEDDMGKSSKLSHISSNSEIGRNNKMKNNTICKTNPASQQMPINRELGSSSSSSASGSLDACNNSNEASSMHASLYTSDDPNIPLDVINPILDLVDEDEDAFSLPLSQQDEKLLEELLR